MKTTFTLLALLGAALGAPRARAQCHAFYSPAFYHSCHQKRDSCAVDKPLVPGRWAGYAGLLGATDRRGTPYAGFDLEGYYWVGPRWSAGLRGTLTAEMPVASAPAEVYAGAAQPRVMLYSVTFSTNLLLKDNTRWRLAVQAGAGLGGANLYDNARQVSVKGGGCGCTHAERIAMTAAPVSEVGLAATYKLKSKNAPWLTLRGGYRQWNGGASFGTFNQFSAYTLSLGVSLPDAPPRRK
ncbi:hypothetical protein [Hymenobacter ruricola]|uniref:Outer membrane protein beta-barrel domain-containing protein n=1 Tax=Hymenobacter ruricola TaxID=2791023 RepID=A0ABS0IA12_9BACT|nr:hypothetical protein [Hymenobacter ruricola]MBF9223427.1 hypothetical protein [Hymenobacter ruricola]